MIYRILFLFLISTNTFTQEEKALNLRRDNSDEKKKVSETIQQYPELEKFLFREPESPFSMGVGISPIGLLGSKFFFSVSLFQVHYETDLFDFELFNASFGKAFSNNEFADSTNFSIRTSQKFKLFKFMDTGVFSFGTVIGIELVQFDKVDVRLKKQTGTVGSQNQFKTTDNAVKLTTIDMIYGAAASQTFKLKSGKTLKVSQIYYVQNYDISKTRFDWEYDYENDAVEEASNLSELEKDSVFMVEFSYLF